jgi:hypothetical protein
MYIDLAITAVRNKHHRNEKVRRRPLIQHQDSICKSGRMYAME